MKHRSIIHSFMLLLILNSSAEQVRVPLISFVSGTKPAALPDLLLSSESSLGRANAWTHQSERRRLNLSSSFPLENGELLSSGAYSLPRAFLKDLWNEYSCDALPGISAHTAHLQDFSQGTPLRDHLDEFDVLKPLTHSLYWESVDGENVYPERLKRHLEFCQVAESLGIPLSSGEHKILLYKEHFLIKYYAYRDLQNKDKHGQA